MAQKAGRNLRPGALLIIAGIALGCAGNPAQPAPLPQGQPFELRAGATANVASNLTVTFVRVNSDSRCPMDALCVWAGEALITIALGQPASPAFSQPTESPGVKSGICTAESNRAECVLATTASGSTASYGAQTIRLVQLAPYPGSATPIRPGEYVATLTISAR
jgi:hypothetical protein